MSGLTERDLLAPLPMMSDGDLPADCERAWLAGFIDGEGTIGMTLLLLRAILGRDVRVSKPDRKDHRPIFVIAIQNRPDIKTILELVRPWLVVKRPQADLMLEYIGLAPIRIVPRSPSNRRSRAVATDRHTEVHFELVRKMHLLNQRFAPGEWSEHRPSVTREGRLEWPDRSVDEDREADQLKRWWRLHFDS